MLRKTILVAVVAAGLATAGCGGGGDGGDGGNKLSPADQVKVVQARADVKELCGVGNLKGPQTVQSRALQDAAAVAMIGSVPELIAVYRKNPQKLYVDEAKKTVTMRQLLLQQAAMLAKCGGPNAKKFASQLKTAAR